MKTPVSKSDSNFLDIIDVDFEISRGSSLPLGASLQRGGINFSVFSKNATHVTLVIFIPGQEKPIAEFPLDPRFNRTGDIWHAFVKGLDANIEYGYRVDQKPNHAPHIHCFDSSLILIDPYARALAGGEKWGDIKKKLCPQFHPRCRRSLVVDDNFDWEYDQPLNIPLSDSIIYELHVRGFTRDQSSQTENPGTYAGLIEKIPYLKDLGINAVELLPINEFEETDTICTNPLTGKPLLNFWGYHSINFFSPNASYAANASAGSQVNEFKTMVKAFHKANIEVILDVVFNHTCEGDERGPTLSFRGLDNPIYYLIDPDTGAYHNYTGCGNTLNCNHPVVRDLILECLRYWVTEMHVDGFRFDLASVLGRGQDGSVLANPPLLERIAADPILSGTKLIAEAWDAAGLYQVGSFPAWGRWAEWNGKFRDDIRKFIKGDPGMVSSLANRIMGSPDVYQGSGRQPYHSINFITCHDGFTLSDLVANNEKHNQANGENNIDGDNNNNSWNCGWEGSTRFRSVKYGFECTLDKIDSLRSRQIKNFATLLMLSRGVPMLLAGDEFGRTQKGNNNAYCQDNETSWINWNFLENNRDLHRFFKLLIKFRQDHPALRYDNFAAPDNEHNFPITWHGIKLSEPDFSYNSRSLAWQVSERGNRLTGHSDIYICANAYWKRLDFALPVLKNNKKWHRAIDTSLDNGNDVADPGSEPVLLAQSVYPVALRSVIVLKSN